MVTSNRILLILTVIVLLLIAPAWLMQPDLDQSIFQQEVATYPKYLLHYSIIFSGLLLTVISLIVFLVSIFSTKASAKDKLVNLGMLVLVFVVGWMAIPYWTNGLYNIFSNGTSSLFDPKDLLPMTLIGEVWRIPILFMYPLILLYLIFSFIRIIVVVIRKKNLGINELLILISSILVIVAAYFTPHYFYWLLD